MITVKSDMSAFKSDRPGSVSPSIIVLSLTLLMQVTFASVAAAAVVMTTDIQCLARVHLDVVNCTWTAPSATIEGYDGCDLYFRLNEKSPHIDESSCNDISNWTRCQRPTSHGCQFPASTPGENGGRGAVFSVCGPYIDMMIGCRGGDPPTVETIVENHFNSEASVLPFPPINVRIDSLAKYQATVSWDIRWEDIDSFLHYIDTEMEYWQNASFLSDKRYHTDGAYSEMTETFSKLLVELHSYVQVCVRVRASFNMYGHENFSDWSDTVCGMTMMDTPKGKPGTVISRTIRTDWETSKRVVNLTWLPIPIEDQRGPILRYEVKVTPVQESSSSVKFYNVTGSKMYLTLDLNTNSSYIVTVSAVNPEGASEVSHFQLDEVTAPPSRTTYIAITLTAIIIIVTLVSIGALIRKKMKAGHLPDLKLLSLPPSTKCKSVPYREVFDQLNPKGSVEVEGRHRSCGPSDEKREFLSKDGGPADGGGLGGSTVVRAPPSPTEDALYCDMNAPDGDGSNSPREGYVVTSLASDTDHRRPGSETSSAGACYVQHSVADGEEDGSPRIVAADYFDFPV